MTAKIGSLPSARRALLRDHPYLSNDHPGDRRLLLGALGVAALLHVLFLMLDLPALRTAIPAQPPPPEPEILHPLILNPPEIDWEETPAAPSVSERLAMIPVRDAEPPEPVKEAARLETSWSEPAEFEFLVDAIDPPRPSGPLDMTVPGVEAPVLIEETRVKPTYPELARKIRMEGKVVLEAVVFADGTVGEVKVLLVKPEGLGFAEAAIEAVRQWRYEPATQRGRPVDVYFTVNIRFELR